MDMTGPGTRARPCGLGPHIMVGGATFTSLRGMAATVGGAKVSLVPVEKVAGEVNVVGIVEPRGLIQGWCALAWTIARLRMWWVRKA